MKPIEKKSRLLSRWLRHRPEAISLEIDKAGWVDVSDLLLKSAAAGFSFTREELEEVVAENDKQRFSFNSDCTRVRAAQGHSINVDLKIPFKAAPPVLYHGTVEKFIAAIRRQGLLPGTRRDVHLSATRETAEAVGARRGTAVVLVVETNPLIRDGYRFRCAENGVWLIPGVPAKYLRFPDI